MQRTFSDPSIRSLITLYVLFCGDGGWLWDISYVDADYEDETVRRLIKMMI